MPKLKLFSTLAFGLLVPAATTMAWEPAPWTRTDTYWELGYLAVVAMDCGQSCQINELGRYERNPFLPRQPNPRTVRMIYLGSVVGQAAIAYVLPVKWRRAWQVTTVTLEVAAVSDNYFRAGLSIKF